MSELVSDIPSNPDSRLIIRSNCSAVICLLRARNETDLDGCRRNGCSLSDLHQVSYKTNHENRNVEYLRIVSAWSWQQFRHARYGYMTRCDAVHPVFLGCNHWFGVLHAVDYVCPIARTETKRCCSSSRSIKELAVSFGSEATKLLMPCDS